MPRSLDGPARESMVVDAAWRVIARDGVAALTVRRVAEEAGLAPSSLRYTFPTQADVRMGAITAVTLRLREQLAALPASLTSREWARAALLELLPLDDRRRLSMQVFLALGTAALTDSSLQTLWRDADAVVREVCAQAARWRGPVARVQVDHLHALVDGLSLHLLGRHTDDGAWAVAVIDAYLADGDRPAVGLGGSRAGSPP